MAIGQIVIGGGVDISIYGDDQELIFRNSPIALTVTASYPVAQTLTDDSSVNITNPTLTSKVFIQ